MYAEGLDAGPQWPGRVVFIVTTTTATTTEAWRQHWRDVRDRRVHGQGPRIEDQVGDRLLPVLGPVRWGQERVRGGEAGVGGWEAGSADDRHGQVW